MPFSLCLWVWVSPSVSLSPSPSLSRLSLSFSFPFSFPFSFRVFVFPLSALVLLRTTSSSSSSSVHSLSLRPSHSLPSSLFPCPLPSLSHLSSVCTRLLRTLRCLPFLVVMLRCCAIALMVGVDAFTSLPWPVPSSPVHATSLAPS